MAKFLKKHDLDLVCRAHQVRASSLCFYFSLLSLFFLSFFLSLILSSFCLCACKSVINIRKVSVFCQST